MAMKPHDIQSVFRCRHIIVLGTPTEDMKFDLDGMSTTVDSFSEPLNLKGQLCVSDQEH
jgi:hypothetical protein